MNKCSFWYERICVGGFFRFLRVNGVLFSLRRLTPPSPLFSNERFFGSSHWEGSWNRLTGVFFRMVIYLSVLFFFALGLCSWSCVFGEGCSSGWLGSSGLTIKVYITLVVCYYVRRCSSAWESARLKTGVPSVQITPAAPPIISILGNILGLL